MVPMTKSRVFLIFLILTAAITLFSLIQPTNREQPVSEQPQKIVNFFHYFSGALSGGIEEMVGEVNAHSDSFTVLASPLDHESFKTMIPTAFERSNPPELFSYWAGEKVNQLVASNRLLPIDDLWQDQLLAEKFTPAIIESAVQYGDHKYLLPITQHIVLFFYNKTIFTDLGLTPPSNWQEFIALCTTLKSNGVTPIALGSRERWPAQFWFDYLLLRTAGPEFRQQLLLGQKLYTDPEVVEAFRLWSDMLQEGYFNDTANQLDWSEAATLVRRGEAAMTLMGTWALQTLEAGADGLRPGKEYDFFPFPIISPGLPNVSVGPIDGIVIARETENAEQAKEVLIYFAGKEAQQRMSDGSGALSPDSSVPQTFYSPLKMRLKEEIDRSDQWAFAYDLAVPTVVADRGLDSFSELVAFPGQYQAILKNLAEEVSRIQDKESREK